MRVIIQRVTKASVLIDSKVKREIDQGLVILLGICNQDGSEDIAWMINKIIQLRIFNDENDKMNLSVKDIKGEILVISQFTLYASTKKGNRPSYINAAKPDFAIPLYEEFLSQIDAASGLKIVSGEFGADMKVELINDGPVTISIDSKNRE